MGEKPPYDDPGVTHGICRTCVEKERAEFIRQHNLKMVDLVSDLLMFEPINSRFKDSIRRKPEGGS